MAPVQYLIDVGTTFEVSLDWLCTGREANSWEPHWKKLLEAMAPITESSDNFVFASYWDVYERIIAAIPPADDGKRAKDSLTDRQKVDVARRLRFIVLAPLMLLRGHYDQLPLSVRDQYFYHILAGLRCAMAPVDSGLNYEELLAGAFQEPADDLVDEPIADGGKP